MTSRSPSRDSSLNGPPPRTPSLATAFRDYVRAAPEATALRCARDGGDMVVLTRRALGDLVLTYGAGLRSEGVRRGDRVVLALGTSVEFVACFWAVLLLGAIAVPTPPIDRRGKQEERLRQLGRMCEVCVPALIVVGAEVGEVDLHYRLAPVDRLETAAPALGEFPLPAGNDIAVLQFTSGSTGRPRGCALSHRAMLTNARANVERLQIVAGDSLVSWLPLFHDMGLMTGILAPIVGGVAVQLRSPARFLVNPLSWLEDLTASGRAHTAVPNFALALTLQRIERRAPNSLRLDQVKSIACGAEPIDPVLVRRFLEALAPHGLDPRAFLAAYGMAEATLMVSSRPGGLATARIAGTEMVNLGRAVPGAAIQIRDAQGRPLAEGEVGEVQVLSPSLMDGYYGDAPATRAKLVGGWLRTGDLGCLVDGELLVAGRTDDLIIVGGRNIYPSDVEYAVARAAGLSPSRIAAFGRPGALGTEAIHVVVESKAIDGRDLLTACVQTACIEACGVAPEGVTIVRSGAIPRTTSGKIRRGELRRQFASDSLAT